MNRESNHWALFRMSLLMGIGVCITYLLFKTLVDSIKSSPLGGSDVLGLGLILLFGSIAMYVSFIFAFLEYFEWRDRLE